MVTNVPTTSPSRMLGVLGISWGWLLALGILMTVLGVIGLGMAYSLTVAAVFWFGILAIVGGIAQILDAFHHKGWKGIVWHVIIGLIYVVAGVLMITMPVASAFWLTLFLAISFIVNGVLRILMAFQIRGQGSIWFAVLLSGLVSVALGVLIYGTVRVPGAEALATAEGQLAWVRSWGWVIGLFVAVELIMEGVALMAISMRTKSAQADDGETGGPVAKPA
jgi:uncharacterized membrane protein HdeD (DUF308 family)